MKVNLVVDVQNGFVSCGPLAIPGAKPIADKIIEYVKSARSKGEAIFATCDTHDPKLYPQSIEGQKLPLHCAEDTEEHKLIEGLVKDENRGVIIPQGNIIDKSTFASCSVAGRIRTAMCELEEPIDEIKVFGFCTSICVLNCALTLRNHLPDKRIVIVTDLCGDVDNKTAQAALLVAKTNLIELVNSDNEHVEPEI